jgi:hypothetical protein
LPLLIANLFQRIADFPDFKGSDVLGVHLIQKIGHLVRAVLFK